LPKNGEDYKVVRASLISQKWIPIKATCNEENRNVCFSEYPELSSGAIPGACGQFEREGSIIEVCTISGPDVMLLNSSRHVR